MKVNLRRSGRCLYGQVHVGLPLVVDTIHSCIDPGVPVQLARKAWVSDRTRFHVVLETEKEAKNKKKSTTNLHLRLVRGTPTKGNKEIPR